MSVTGRVEIPLFATATICANVSCAGLTYRPEAARRDMRVEAVRDESVLR